MSVSNRAGALTPAPLVASAPVPHPVAGVVLTKPTPAEAALIAAAEAIWRHAGRTGAPRTLRFSDAVAASNPQADILVIDAPVTDQLALNDILTAARRTMAAGGMITGQFRPAKAGAVTRDTLSIRLFEAGYTAPMIWADKGALVAEARILKPLAHLLNAQALGNAPEGFAHRLPSGANTFAFVAALSPLAPPAERRKVLSVVFPVFNEQATFKEVMDALLAKSIDGMDIEVVLVESNSTDGTRDIALTYKDHPRVKLILQERPRGKGFGVREGFSHATGDIILIQDADFEYSLDDYATVLAPILESRVSFVLGSRHSTERRSLNMREFKDQKMVGKVLNLGHIFFTTLLNMIYFQRTKDPFTMYKVFRRDCIANMHFESNRFDFDHEMVGKLVRGGHPPLEVPVSYESRSFKDGKKVRVLGDPPTWIKALIKFRFARLHEWTGEPDA